MKQKTKYPVCVGIFISFTAKAMCWRVKEKGESWNDHSLSFPHFFEGKNLEYLGHFRTFFALFIGDLRR